MNLWDQFVVIPLGLRLAAKFACLDAVGAALKVVQMKCHQVARVPGGQSAVTRSSTLLRFLSRSVLHPVARDRRRPRHKNQIFV